MWLHGILGKLRYSQWSFEHGRVYLVFVSLKTYCKELKFLDPGRKRLEQYLSTGAALSLQENIQWHTDNTDFL